VLEVYRGINKLYWQAIARRGLSLLVVMLIMVFIVVLVLNFPLSFPATQDLAVEGLYRILEWGDWSALDIICFAMPVLNQSNIDRKEAISLAEMLLSSFGAIARVDMHSPAALLRSEIPLLAELGSPAAAEISLTRGGEEINNKASQFGTGGKLGKSNEIFNSGTGSEAATSTGGTKATNSGVDDKFYESSRGMKLTETESNLPGTKTLRLPDYMAKNLVAVYNTHTGETYALTDGVERLDGKRGGVVAVAEALEKALEEKYTIMVARSDQIHDQEYSTSYLKSEKTARKLIEENSHLRAVIDIHRDIGKPRKNCVVEIDGKNVARIMFIVGSDKRAPHPNWKKNYAFAMELARKMDEMYPGLCEGVRVQDGRYNQFLHPHAILLEVGGVNNTTEEAVRAAELFADVLAMVIMKQSVL